MTLRQISVPLIAGALLLTAFANPAEAAVLDRSTTDGGADKLRVSMLRDVETPWDLFLELHQGGSAFALPPAMLDPTETPASTTGHIEFYDQEEGRIYTVVFDRLGSVRLPQVLHTDYVPQEQVTPPRGRSEPNARSFRSSTQGLFPNAQPAIEYAMPEWDWPEEPIRIPVPTDDDGPDPYVPSPASAVGLLLLSPMLLARRRRRA
ncbi:MAG: hypothetical protein ACOCTI_03210 [Phycisphaeraceae bacterium]